MRVVQSHSPADPHFYCCPESQAEVKRLREALAKVMELRGFMEAGAADRLYSCYHVARRALETRSC